MYLCFVLLLVHINTVYLHILEHIDASLLLQFLYNLDNSQPVLALTVGTNLPDLLPVHRLVLQRLHYVLKYLSVIFGIVLESLPDFASSLLLADHYIQVHDMVEHKLHVTHEDRVVLAVELLRVVLRFRDAVVL